MTELIEQYFDKEEVLKIAGERHYESAVLSEYIRFLDKTLKNDLKYGLEVDYKEAILDYVIGYMNLFVEVINKGFSLAWSREYAAVYYSEENDSASAYAYIASKKSSQEHADADLRLFASVKNRDEDFIKHFKYLINLDSPDAAPSIEQQADKYSQIFKSQLSKGFSEIFANRFAGTMAMEEYSELYCFAEAAEYEKATQAGYSNAYSEAFAAHISEYIADEFLVYEDSLNDELTILERKEIEQRLQHLK